MKITNDRIIALLKRFRAIANDPETPDEYADFFTEVHNQLLDGALDYEETIEQLRIESIRNPAFAGDIVGWLDDDYSDGYCPKCKQAWIFHGEDGECPEEL